MNIFVTDVDPKIAARNLCDKHINKMLVESVQLLCSPFENNTAPYKRTHFNHPCAIWVRTSENNYKWLLEHANEIYCEYLKRFGKSTHKSNEVLQWCNCNFSILNLPKIGITSFAQAMPIEYKSNDSIQSYRNYYMGVKHTIAKWEKGSAKPFWWNL